MIYERVYRMLYDFAVWQVVLWGHDISVCRSLALIVLFVMVVFSRLLSSYILKFFSVLIALILYFLPDVVKLFL